MDLKKIKALPLGFIGFLFPVSSVLDALMINPMVGPSISPRMCLCLWGNISAIQMAWLNLIWQAHWISHSGSQLTSRSSFGINKLWSCHGFVVWSGQDKLNQLLPWGLTWLLSVAKTARPWTQREQ